MSRSRAVRVLLTLATTALVVAALWLPFDNPTIDGTSRGDDYDCLAPWDTVLNDADNFPGGEPPPDGDQIAERCREAGRGRFEMAVGAGAAAMGLALATPALPLRRERRKARPSA